MAAQQPYVIAPSLLSADFCRLGEQAQCVVDAGAEWLHLDVMDGRFVPNITIGPLVCQALSTQGIAAVLDVHLMIVEPERWIDAFAKAGAKRLTVHAEGTTHLHRTLAAIRDAGMQAGVSLNPATPLQVLTHVWQLIDQLLIMTVNPGFGGQRFIATMLPKICEARVHIETLHAPVRLVVDGGIGIDTITSVAAAGADTFVVGSAVFATESPAQAVHNLRNALAATA